MEVRRRKPLPLYVWVALAVFIVGCTDRPAKFNSDSSLHKTMAQFAAQSAKLSYPTTAPSGDAAARVSVSYGRSLLDIGNFSEEDWTNVQVWVNEKYVCILPTLPKGQIRTLPFAILFDKEGNFFPTDHAKSPVSKVVVVHGSKVQTVTAKLED